MICSRGHGAGQFDNNVTAGYEGRLRKGMENEMNDYKIGTKCVQAGYTPENGQPRQIPIIHLPLQ